MADPDTDFAALCRALAEATGMPEDGRAVQRGLIAVLRRMREPSEAMLIGSPGDGALNILPATERPQVLLRNKGIVRAMIDELLRQAEREAG